MNSSTQKAIIRDLKEASCKLLRKHMRTIASRRGVTAAEVESVHDQERIRKLRLHDGRRRLAMQCAVTV